MGDINKKSIKKIEKRFVTYFYYRFFSDVLSLEKVSYRHSICARRGLFKRLNNKFNRIFLRIEEMKELRTRRSKQKKNYISVQS